MCAYYPAALPVMEGVGFFCRHAESWHQRTEFSRYATCQKRYAASFISPRRERPSFLVPRPPLVPGFPCRVRHSFSLFRTLEQRARCHSFNNNTLLHNLDDTMKLQFLTVLSAVLVVANAHDVRNPRHANLARQAAAAVSPAASPPAASSAAPAAPAAPASASAAPPAAAATPAAASPPAASPAAPPAAPAPNGPPGVPPLASITSGMPADPTMPVPTTYPAGAVPTYSGASPLPTACMS